MENLGEFGGIRLSFQDEEKEELAVNHSGMWNFREFGGIWGHVLEFGRIWWDSVPFPLYDKEEEELAVNHLGKWNFREF